MNAIVGTHVLVDEDGRSAGILRAVDDGIVTYLATHRRAAQRRAMKGEGKMKIGDIDTDQVLHVSKSDWEGRRIMVVFKDRSYRRYDDPDGSIYKALKPISDAWAASVVKIHRGGNENG